MRFINVLQNIICFNLTDKLCKNRDPVNSLFVQI